MGNQTQDSYRSFITWKIIFVSLETGLKVPIKPPKERTDFINVHVFWSTWNWTLSTWKIWCNYILYRDLHQGIKFGPFSWKLLMFLTFSVHIYFCSQQGHLRLLLRALISTSYRAVCVQKCYFLSSLWVENVCIPSELFIIN